MSQANQMSVVVHRDHPPPTYRMTRLPAINSIIGYGNSKIGYKIIRFSHR